MYFGILCKNSLHNDVHVSEAFDIYNGVHQGSLLSPQPFNVYVNDLSQLLNNATVGCTINNVSVTHFMYAEDLVLMALSASGL